MPRFAIKDFELARPIYRGASVTFYTVAAGVKTNVKATLYKDTTSATQLANPQKLDAHGRFKQPVYIEVPVIGAVDGISIPTHDTGIITPAPTFRVDPSTQKLQYSWDQGVTWSDTGQYIFNYRGDWITAREYNATDTARQGTTIYLCVVPHTSGVFATDLAAGKWVALVVLTAAAVSFTPAGNIIATNVQGAIEELDAEKAPIASPTFTGDPKAPTPTAGDNDTSIATTAFVQAAIVALATGVADGLTNVIYPNRDGKWRDIVRSGWFPAFFNQQWGGAPMPFELVDGPTGVYYEFDALTGYIEDGGAAINIADGLGDERRSQGFKVAKSATLNAVWVKVAKVGNPANNLECRILPDDGTGTKPTGSTPITNGTATAQSGKLHSADITGQWVRFVFSTPPSLTGNTFYHIELKSSGANDAANYWVWRVNTTGKYPHGNIASGTAGAVWTASVAQDFVFLVEAAATDQVLQSGGQFDHKIVGYEGTPLNQSAALCRPLKGFFNQRQGTIRIVGESFTKDKPVFDFLYGFDHDRLTLRAKAATGVPLVTLYDSSGNVRQVEGSTDISTSGVKDIWVEYRCFGDGADYLRLRVQGASEGTPLTSQTITVDPLWEQLGTAWMLGGFPLAVTWTQKLDMSTLPSAASPAWTWTGTGTEANCMSVSGGKLYQNKNGYANADSGYYAKSGLSLSNANGYVTTAKLKIRQSTNTKDTGPVVLRTRDGTKEHDIDMAEFFFRSFKTSSYYPQVDLKTCENVVYTTAKGSDYFDIVNGRIVVDGTAVNDFADATNDIRFGDIDTGAGENADVVWDYVAYYNTAWLPPQCSSGSLSEFSYWSKDASGLNSTLWNSGSPRSTKQFSGVQKGYVGEQFVQKRTVVGVTLNPTTGASALMPDMLQFVIGAELRVDQWATMRNNISGSHLGMFSKVDGVVQASQHNSGGLITFHSSGNDFQYTVGTSYTVGAEEGKIQFGPHVVELWMYAGSNTTMVLRRQQTAEARA